MHDVADRVVLVLAGPPALEPSQAAVSQIRGVAIPFLGKRVCELLLHRRDRVLSLDRINLGLDLACLTIALLTDCILCRSGASEGGFAELKARVMTN